MIYSNYDFMLAFSAFIVWFYNATSARQQGLLLLFASTVFLAWTSVWNLLPVAIVIIATFIYFRFDSTRPSRSGFVAIIVLLVINLAYFKYRGFIADSFGFTLPIPDRLSYFIPLGISFYTFEAISAVVDVRRKRLPTEGMKWSLFIMLFPHLIAGPIVRYRQLYPQFGTLKKFASRNLMIGMHLFTLGFIKKLAADPLGFIIDPVWAAPSQAPPSALLLALLGFYVQLYLDFSGYTDMGRGVARMMGFRLPINFRAPFLAASPAEFYQRWHVSLSSWIRTFVYDTLAVAVLRRVSRSFHSYALLVVVLVVMMISGLWHGANWTFIAWGAFHGVALLINVAFRQVRGPVQPGRVGMFFGWLLTFAVFTIGMVLFRAPNFAAAGRVLGAMAGVTHSPVAEHGLSVDSWLINNGYISDLFVRTWFGTTWSAVGTVWTLVALVVALLVPDTMEIANYRESDAELDWRRHIWKWQPSIIWLASICGLFLASCNAMQSAAEFIYYQF
jgi:alginate O-acetyltransferase complex protein AlgI